MVIKQDSSQLNIISSIVPWALPGEEIPIRIEIPRKLTFDKIKIKIPSDFIFKDFLNIAEVSITENIAEIHELIKTKSIETPIYFGFVVTSTNIPKKLKISKGIYVDLLLNDKVIKHKEVNARIFRPLLEITNFNEVIELKDNIKEYEVPMDILYVGFGDVKLDITAEIEDKIKGQIISESETVVNELLKRMIIDSQTEPNTEKTINNTKLNINDAYLEFLINRIVEKINKSDFSDLSDLLSEEEMISCEKLFSNPKDKDKFLNVVYTRVEDILLGVLSEQFETHPTDNVKLTNSQTNIKVKINSQITNITTHLIYKDPVGNEYPPIKRELKIIDNRNDRSQSSITMPIRVKKWEENPFLNVVETNIEEDY